MDTGPFILNYYLGESWVRVPYVASAVLFILSILGLGQHKTAKAGNLYGVIGMMVCTWSLYAYEMVATTKKYPLSDTFARENHGWYIVPIMIIVGSIIGIMTSMPVMVGALNAFGGLAAAMEGVALFFSRHADYTAYTTGESRMQMLFLLLSIVIGLVTFVGSILAAIKVGKNVSVPIPLPVSIFFILVIITFMILTGLSGFHYAISLSSNGLPVLQPVESFYQSNYLDILFMSLLCFFSCIYGVIFVLPIGGADMPVVISVLNAFSGMSGCFAGFMVQNDLLITTGSLVASSGAILSYIMCKAMNRSLMSVLLGGFGTASSAVAKAPASGSAPSKATDAKPVEVKKEAHPIQAEELFKLLAEANSVVIVPGYGLAAARAQVGVASLVNSLQKAGKRIRFGIHPVAGRLPGHMNVLLAEASISYDIVLEMDEINPDMKTTDVCLVIGANDTVNPDAVNNKSCGIYGMPVIHAWESKHVVVFKRNLDSAGYADVFNPLLYAENSFFYKGDANETLKKLNDHIATHVDTFSNGNSSGSETKKAEAVIKNYAAMPTCKKIGVPKELAMQGETRVAMTPDMAGRMREMGFHVIIESQAGLSCNFTDSEYSKMGCEIMQKDQLFAASEIVMKINEPTDKEVQLLHRGQILVSYCNPDTNQDLLENVKSKDVTWLAMDKVPRISIAQKLDSLSSMGKISGYRAVVEGMNHYQGFFSSQITAAGKYPPVKVLVIGAGVAGLEAVGAAKLLGAEVYCFDTRSECAEQVMSMGGKFLDLKVASKESGAGAGGYAKTMSPEYIVEEMKLFKEKASECGIIITTAAIPGKRAPLLLLKEAVDAMKSGSVIVDTSVRTGGNCEITRLDDVYVTDNGVTIVGYINLPGRMPRIASEMYANNMFRLMEHMGKAQQFDVNMTDEVIRPMIVCKDGAVVSSQPKADAPKAPAAPVVAPVVAPVKESNPYIGVAIAFVIAAVVLPLIAIYFPISFYAQLMVFALSCAVGYLSVWGVTSALHTPLMSVTNAISGVVVLGALPFVLDQLKSLSYWFGMIAVFVSAINIGGGFYVTHRMLQMFTNKQTASKPAPTTTAAKAPATAVVPAKTAVPVTNTAAPVPNAPATAVVPAKAVVPVPNTAAPAPNTVQSKVPAAPVASALPATNTTAVTAPTTK